MSNRHRTVAGSPLPRLTIDDWDSSFFNTRIARFDIKGTRSYPRFSSVLRTLCADAENKGSGYLIIRAAGRYSVYKKAFLDQGFKKCGESVDLMLKMLPGYHLETPHRYTIRRADRRHTGAIGRIAKDAFRKSYLYRCGLADMKEIDRYHSVWTANLLRDQKVVSAVAMVDGTTAGFAQVRFEHEKTTARIVLIAVAKWARGKGIGTALLDYCIRVNRRTLKKVYVRTQRENRRAAALYTGLGFVPVANDIIFCKRLSHVRFADRIHKTRSRIVER